MRTRLTGWFLAIALCLPYPLAWAAAQYKIVTASERGTYIRIGQDLARFVAPAADIELEVLPSAGSAENVRRLRYEPGVKLALVQSDVYQAYVDLAAAGNPTAATLIRPLRVVAPLYDEEIYFVVRADSPLQHLHEIKDARINAGPLGSGTALTVSTLYRVMFGDNLPADGTTFLPNEEALVKLIEDKSVDVVAVIAGQPAKLLADMRPEARQYTRLLRFDSNAAASRAALEIYYPATVRAANYPNLLTEDLPALAVKALLVTYDYNLEATRSHLTRFARALCTNFNTLQAEGHPKWREIGLQLPELSRGLTYYQPTRRVLERCDPAEAAPARRAAPARECSQQDRILGTCS